MDRVRKGELPRTKLDRLHRMNAGLPWDCVLGAELVRHYKAAVESLSARRHRPFAARIIEASL